MPPEEKIRDRNIATCASYAGWFLRHPDWFRWAGMASFASYRVGMLLAIYDFSYLCCEPFPEKAAGGVLDNARMVEGIEILRQANNISFLRAGWAHLAYESPEGGIEAVEEGIKETLEEEPNQKYFLEGFREIERARKMSLDPNADKSTADKLFWHGNYLVLKYEQWGAIQEHFEKLDLSIGLTLNVITSLDFSANHFIRDKNTYCGFYKYMWTNGIGKLIQTMSLPDIKKLDHRWSWVENLVFPTWQRVVRTDREISTRMMRIVRSALPFDSEVLNPNKV